MLTIRPVAADELDAFAALDPETRDLAETIRALWANGSGRPEWTLVAEEGGRWIGRAALTTEPFGCGLEVREGRLAGLWLADEAPPTTGRMLLDAIATRARGVTPFIERRLNPELHGSIASRRHELEEAGYTLFQEKQGFVWTDDGGVLPEPQRLTFRSLAEVGRPAYAAAMAAAIPGTLDRNDRFYLDACGPAGWGTEMAGAAEPEDASSWLLAYELDGTPAGYVGVGSFDGDVGTIVHIGVMPDRRGRGYVDELLRAANHAARGRGLRSMLSDVDTENAPMLAAMVRNEHLPDVRPWHVWAYRRVVEGW